MTIPNIALTVVVAAITGSALPNAKVALTLTRADIVNEPGGALVPVGRTVIQCDANGLGSGTVFPNALGTQGTGYLVEVFTEQGALAFTGRASIPNQNCKLHDVLFTIPPMSTGDADAAVLKARAWASQDTTPVEATPTPLYSAKYYALQGSGSSVLAANWAAFVGGEVPTAPAGSRSSRSWAQENLVGATYGGSARDWSMGAGLIDGVTYKSARGYALDGAASAGASATSAAAAAANAAQTALDRAQTGSDVVTTGGSRDTALGASLTATAQAALASVMALSAASVTQQDLTGVQVAALHRSPNAIVQAFSYDTRRDSNPNWPRQCANTSWENESLNGAWIPVSGASGIPSEVVARAKGGTLGTDVVTNGSNGFSATTGYTGVGASLSVVASRLRITSTGGAVEARSTITTVVGQAYLMEVEGYAGTGGNLVARVGTSAGGQELGNVSSNTGTLFAVFVATGVTTNLTQTQVSSSVGTFSDFGKISVRPVTAWAVSSGYFQLSTDGKHYRIWRNVLKGTGVADMSSAAWTRSNIASVGADGRVVPTAGNLGTHLTQAFTALPGIKATVLVKAKADQLSKLWVSYGNTGNTLAYGIVLDLATGSTVTATSVGGGTLVVNGSTVDGAGYRQFNITIGNGIGEIVTQVRVGPTAIVNGAPGQPDIQQNVNNAFNGTDGLYIQDVHVQWGVDTAAVYEAKAATDAGVSETFRGNKRQFPIVPAFVEEGARVVIYDTLEPGRPMWMVFAGNAVSGGTALSWALANPVLTGMAFREGVLAVTGSNGCGTVLFSFPRDDTRVAYNGPFARAKRLISDRQNAAVVITGDGYTLAGIACNSVAMYTMPEAPVDPTTGLQVPTLGVGTTTGLSVIKHDGTVVNSASTGNFKGVSINQYMVCANATTSQFFYALAPASLGAAFTFTLAPTTGGLFNGLSSSSNPMGRRGRVGQFLNANPELQFAAMNEANFLTSLFSRIRDTYSTGITVGDIRRAWLCDTVVGVLDSANTTINGDFSAGTANWGITGAAWSIAAGQATLSAGAGNFDALRQSIAIAADSTWELSFDVVSVTGTFSAEIGGGLVNITAPGSYSIIRTYTGVGFSYGFAAAGVACTAVVDNVQFRRAAGDRGYKNRGLAARGTLTKTAVAVGSQVVAYSGFSAANYLQEPYSADHDYGTGSWLHAPTCSIPAANTTNGGPVAGGIGSTLPYLNLTGFGVAQNVVVNATTQWTLGTGWSASNATTFVSSGAQTGNSDANWNNGQPTPGVGVVRKWSLNVTALAGGSLTVFSNTSGPIVIAATGTYTLLGQAGGSSILRLPAGVTCTVSLQVDELEAAPITNRAAATGPKQELGVNAFGFLVGTANDGTTARVAVSVASLAGAGFISPALGYEVSGSLGIRVNGNLVGQATGAPLLTMNNATAVFTVGRNFAGTSWFPGSICMVRAGATVPTDDGARWAYDQEKQMFQPGAQVTLPDSSAIVDLDYDAQQDKWVATSGAYVSEFSGLVRVSATPVPAGAGLRTSQRQGVRLASRATVNPGVDITILPQNLKEELQRDGEARAAAALPADYDWLGGFTASGPVSGQTVWTSSTHATAIPSGATFVGARMAAGPGMVVNSVMGFVQALASQFTTDIASTGGTGTQSYSFLDFIMPVGIEARDVYAAGALKQEGATKDYTRLFDGFRERVRFAAAPGATAFVRIKGRRMA